MDSLDILDTVGNPEGHDGVEPEQYFSEPDEEIDSTDVLFAPPHLAVLLHKRSKNTTWRIDRLLKVVMRDSCTAELILYNDDSAASDEISYVLDLRANVHKEKEEVESDGKTLTAIFYNLERDDDFMQFEVIPTSTDGVRDVQAFDFILGQYAFKDDSLTKDGIICEGKDRNPNVVAQSFENTGTAVRIALRSGGRYTGQAIRFLGEQYTSFFASHSTSVPSVEEASPTNGGLIDFTQPSPERPQRSEREDQEVASQVGSQLTSIGKNTLDAEAVERAMNRRKWAEGVHSTATSITGAALYPVRWTGRMAAEVGGKGGSDRPNGSEDAVTRAFLDTVGGIGNGIMSVCKGVTEAMGEVGSAIGDSAIHHSTTVHGNEYAENVTRHYVDAASEIGLAGYKVANVAALGWQGVLVNAALEGSTFLISLYEYLMGPVIMQGYMEMMQLPNPKVRRFFVVLRPWSIAFYKNATDITRKPFKIVPTSMLDTLPKLRIRIPGPRLGDEKEKSMKDLIDETIESGISSRDFDDVAKTMYSAPDLSSVVLDDSPEDAYYRRSEYDAFERSAEKAPVDPNAAKAPSTLNRTTGSIRAAITQLGGGDTSHIEICTVDCSTYVLYPPESNIRLWYRELAAASARVETIAKRKSGADEIALYRRLDLYPIKTTIAIKVKRFIRTTPKPSVFDMFIRAISARNAAAVDDDDQDPDASMLESPAPRPRRAYPELLVESERYDPNLAADVELVNVESSAPPVLDPVSEVVSAAEEADSNLEEVDDIPLSPSSPVASETTSPVRRVMMSPEPAMMSPAPSAYSVSPMRRECQELWETYGGDDDESFHEEGFGSRKHVQDADSLGSSDGEEEQYECEEFWETYECDDERLLSGAYFQQPPGDKDKPSVDPAPESLDSNEVITGAGTTREIAEKLSTISEKRRTPAKPSAKTPTKTPTTTKTPVKTPVRDRLSPTKASRMERTPNPHQSSALLSTNVTNINRAFFSPEVQCSIYPVTTSGTVLLAEKHRIPRAPLLTMEQYLQELQTMIKTLSELIATSLDETQSSTAAQGTTATAPAAQIEAEAALRAYRIEQLGLMQQCHSTYALVNPEKVVSDWEVYSNMIDPIEVGRSANIICSKDISKLEIKLNRRHAKVSNFSEWGIAELPLHEIPDFPAWAEGAAADDVFHKGPVSGVKSGASGDGLEAPLQELWLPVTRRSTGEQIGVLLVEAQRLRV